MDVPAVVQATVGIALLCVLPGYVWSKALLPRVGRIERSVFSVALSIAMLTLALYLGSVIAGVKVTATNAVLWSLALTLLGAALLLRRPAR